MSYTWSSAFILCFKTQLAALRLGQDALQVMGSAAVRLGPHRPAVSGEVWEGPGGALGRAMVRERTAGRPWPPQPYEEWVPGGAAGAPGGFYGVDVDGEGDGDGEATPAGAAGAGAQEGYRRRLLHGGYGNTSGGGDAETAAAGAGAEGGYGSGDPGGGGPGGGGSGYVLVARPAASVPGAFRARAAVEGLSLLLPPEVGWCRLNR